MEAVASQEYLEEHRKYFILQKNWQIQLQVLAEDKAECKDLVYRYKATYPGLADHPSKDSLIDGKQVVRGITIQGRRSISWIVTKVVEENLMHTFQWICKMAWEEMFLLAELNQHYCKIQTMHP